MSDLDQIVVYYSCFMLVPRIGRLEFPSIYIVILACTSQEEKITKI